MFSFVAFLWQVGQENVTYNFNVWHIFVCMYAAKYIRLKISTPFKTFSCKKNCSYILSTILFSYQIKTSNANSILLLRGVANFHKQIKLFFRNLTLLWWDWLLYMISKILSSLILFDCSVIFRTINWFQLFPVFTPIALLIKPIILFLKFKRCFLIPSIINFLVKYGLFYVI